MKFKLVKIISILLVGAALSACVLDDKEKSDSEPALDNKHPAGGDSSVPHNISPTITGDPILAVEARGLYSFMPTASDDDNDDLTFSIANKPGWAAFDPTNGRLSGIPSLSDVGLFENIVISVGDGSIDVALPAFSIDVQAVALQDCNLTTVHCVSVAAGAAQEFYTVQEALAVAVAGDVIRVFEGSYRGFIVEQGGTENNPITIVADGRVDLTGSAPGYNNVVRLQNVSHVTIDGFHIIRDGSSMSYNYNNSCLVARGATADNPMRGLVVRNVEIAGCSPGGSYFAHTDGLVLENNYFHNNVVATNGNSGHAVYLANAGADNVYVKGNTLSYNDGPGLHFNGDACCGGDGLQTGHTIINNIIIGNGHNGFNMDGVQSSMFINNIFADNARYAVRVYQIDGAAGPKDFIFINNTFYSNGQGSVKLTEDVGGHHLLNNLVVASPVSEFVIYETAPRLAGNLFSNDQNIFVNAANQDFGIRDGSAAVDSGVRSLGAYNAPENDLNDFVRSGLPDVGAYELGSGN